jgi:phosphoribosylcarboxyaminoimidazole (NCAIR) mutase
MESGIVAASGDAIIPPLVGIIMGSDSDLPVMAAAGAVLAELGIAYEERIVSAHRTPDAMREYALGAAGRRR